MALVEGVRGPDPVRFCDICQEYTLQLIASWWGDRELTAQGIPTEYSHIGPTCVVCLDKIEKGEIDVGEPPRERVA